MGIPYRRIRDRRIELGISVDELASCIDKNRSTIYRYENGEIENLPVAVIYPLAKALQTTPDYLIGLVDEPGEKQGNIYEVFIERIVDLEKQVEILEYRNKNLLRIAKERANADRNLRPKKKHCGYLLQSMTQVEQEFCDKWDRKKAQCWEIQMQTPYVAGIDFMTIEALIISERAMLMEKLNLCAWYEADELEQMPIEQFNDIWKGTDNFIFGEVCYKLDNEKGYWEIVFHTRYDIPLTSDILKRTL